MRYIDEDTIKEIEELNKKIGRKVWYRGSWGHNSPELAVFNGAEYVDEKHAVLVDVTCEDGDLHWGYTDQIEFIEEEK